MSDSGTRAADDVTEGSCSGGGSSKVLDVLDPVCVLISGYQKNVDISILKSHSIGVTVYAGCNNR